METVQEPANIKYAKQILSLLERDIIENRGRISTVEFKRRELYEEEKRLKKERYDILRELSKLETEASSCEEQHSSIFTDETFKGRLLKGKVFDD